MKQIEIADSILAEWARLIAAAKPSAGFVVTRYDEPFDDTVFATEAEAEASIEERTGNGFGVAPVSETLTVGYSPEAESWGYQTGDNSFTGGAYGYPVWGVAYLTADSDPAEVAKEISEEILSQLV